MNTATDPRARRSSATRGEHSPMLSGLDADRVVQRLAHGRLVDIRGGAHDLGVQQPEVVAARSLDFLRP